MFQKYSNGESSFEIIDKKNHNFQKAESASNISPVLSTSSGASLAGSMLSNVPPPSLIPDFTLCPSPDEAKSNVTASISQTISTTTRPVGQASIDAVDQFPSSQFSAAIPPSKGFQHGAVSQITGGNDKYPRGFMGLFKEAFSGSGVLSKMAEKAKSSVDSIITTLDPQMSEYIYSSGDTEVTVISENEEDVNTMREAFHSVFGKAWVNGIQLNLPGKKSQAVGFEEALKNAEEKLEYSLKYRKTPTVAIENILFHLNNDWYDLSLLIIKDKEKQITVQTFSQTTPVPVDQFLKRIESDRPDCKSLSTEHKLALYLQIKPEWRHDISGVPRKDILLLAAKTLVSIYKNKLIK